MAKTKTPKTTKTQTYAQTITAQNNQFRAELYAQHLAAAKAKTSA